MLTPEQVKPLLLHEDFFIREAAGKYFGEAFIQDPDVAQLVLEACRLYGCRENWIGLSFCSRFPLTENALQLAVELLAKGTDERSRLSLNETLAALPVEIFLAHEKLILDCPGVEKETEQRLRRRCDLAQWSAEKAWQELQDLAQRSADIWDSDKLDLTYAEDLIEVLGQSSIPDGDTICRLLDANEHIEDAETADHGWLEIFLVGLAGARQLREAVPGLVRRFQIDADLLLERCQDSLARIADPEASQLIQTTWSVGNEWTPVWSAGVLGRIKHPVSEEAALALLEIEEDQTTRAVLCIALCDLFSERGIEAVQRTMERGYDEDYVDLTVEVLPVADVLGIRLPEGERWRKARAEEEARMRRLMAEREKRPVTSPRQPIPPPISAPAFRPSPPLGFDMTRPRAGRNEPCPCGSGKKYKKCCGKNA